MRTKLRKFIRSRHRLAPNGRFFMPEVPANRGDSLYNSNYISYLDDAQFFLP
jgi:hypothetical protein